MTKTTIILSLFMNSFVMTSFVEAQESTHKEIIRELNSPRLNEVISEIRNHRQANGVAMDYYSYLALIGQKKLKDIELYPAYMELIEHQKSIINKEQLMELQKAKIDSISTFYCEYSSELLEKGQLSFKQNRFAIDRGKIFSEINTGVEKDRLNMHKRVSYDGDVWRFTQQSPPDIDKYFAEITKENKAKSIYADSDYLKYCFLRTPPIDKGLSNYDLGNLLNQNHVMIQEKLVSDNGKHYLFVTNGLYELYLDPEMDFTVAKVITRKITIDEQGYLKEGAKMTYSRIHSDFVNSGNGIWIPQKIEEKYVRYEIEEHITLTNFKVNDSLDSNLFKDDIFVVGTYIKDTVNNLGYIFGYPNAIEKELDKMLSSEEIIPEENLKQVETNILVNHPNTIKKEIKPDDVSTEQGAVETTKTEKKQQFSSESITTGIIIMGAVALVSIIAVLKKKGNKSE